MIGGMTGLGPTELVSENFGIARDACKYWQEQDGGMHLLAVALYTGYKQASSATPEPYSRWFSRAVHNGQLRGSTLQQTVQSFFSPTHCH
jgi:hypothetical protein